MKINNYIIDKNLPAVKEVIKNFINNFTKVSNNFVENIEFQLKN